MTKDRSSFSDILDAAKSLKLTATLLLLIIISSTIGTLVAQKTQTNMPLMQIYSPEVLRILLFFNFTDLYHSWWFTLLLVGLFVNLLACTIDRIPPILKIMKIDYSKTPLKQLSSGKDYKKIKVDEEKLRKIAGEKLKGFEQIDDSIDPDGNKELRFFKSTGGYSRLTFAFIHLALLTIMVGASVVGMFGFNGQLPLRENETASEFYKDTPTGGMKKSPMGFELKCNSFKIEYYKDRPTMPKQYYAELEVIEKGKTILKDTFYVNKPLFYKDLNFYQSSYGNDSIMKLVISNDDVSYEKEISSSKPTIIEEAKIQIMPIEYKTNFNMQGHKDLGPAVQLEVRSPGGSTGPFWVFKNYPKMSGLRGEYRYTLLDLKEKYYTILQVSKSPHIWLIWLGCVMLIIGLSLVPIVAHKRYYIIHDPKTDQAHIAFKSSKNFPGADKEFEKVLKTLS